MSFHSKIFVILTAVAIAGCSSGTSPSTSSTDPANDPSNDEPNTTLSTSYEVSTVYDGGTSVFDTVKGIAVDASGTLYVADRGDCTILKITSGGTMTVLAGTTGAAGFADGSGAAAKFHYPEDIAIGPDGNFYVADSYNNRIRKVTLDGTVTTVAGSTDGKADGPVAGATFSQPNGIAVDSAGTIYVTDNNLKIRKIANGTVSTWTETHYGNRGMSVNSDGSKLYLTNNANYESDVLTFDTGTGKSTVLAGTGTAGFLDAVGNKAQFSGPSGIVVDSHGVVYVADADAENSRIRRIDTDGTVTTIAGSTPGKADGAGADAKFNKPTGIAMDASGNLYVSDTGNNCIRKLTPKS